MERPQAGAVYSGFVHRADGAGTQALSPAEALRSLTMSAPASLGRPASSPWTVGASADFLILRPGVDWPLEEMMELPIEATVFDGRVR